MTYDRAAIGQVVCTFMDKRRFIAWCQERSRKTAARHVMTLNPEMIMLAERDQEFRQALQRADLCVPDGAGIVWARWYLRSAAWPLLPSLLAFIFQPVERITGVDAVMELADLCAKAQRPLYLLGGTERAAAATAERISRRHPGVAVHRSRAHAYETAGPADILADIARVQPAVLLVAYGAPRQAVWIERHRAALPVGTLAVGVGGAFDILSETLPRAPRWLRRLNLEWLWRLYLEPRRLPRSWRAVVRFPWLMRRYKRRLGGVRDGMR